MPLSKPLGVGLLPSLAAARGASGRGLFADHVGLLPSLAALYDAYQPIYIVCVVMR